MDRNAVLRVNEIFGPTFQGEGPSLGRRVGFLRLAGCNLQCRWCDTWYTWNFGAGDGVEERFGNKTVKMSDESHEMTLDEVAEKIRALGVDALVVSGGEPMLQQSALGLLLRQLRAMQAVSWVEMETNGTLPFTELADDSGRTFFLHEEIDRIHCSPKLAHSGNGDRLRRHVDVLKHYDATGKAIFKFVVRPDQAGEDAREIRKYLAEACIDVKKAWLMPLGMTREELRKSSGATAQLAKEMGCNFTPRLHIELWGSKRGV